jgi:hypothetical protein
MYAGSYVYTRGIDKIRSCCKFCRYNAAVTMVHMRAEFVGTQFADNRTTFTHCPVCVKMFKKFEKPAACEMRSVIHFLNAKNMKPADIHLQLCEVHGEYAMCDSTVRRWV